MKFICLSFSFLVLLLVSNNLKAQQPLIEALNKNLIEIKTISPSRDFSDLARLKDILADKKIIAIGEATYGSTDFDVFKHRMIEYLVTRLKFKTIVIEADFSGTAAINDYVVNGNGNPYDNLKKTAFWMWRNPDVLEMIEWIKKYNLSQADLNNKISFYGFDMRSPIAAAAALIKGDIKIAKPLSQEALKGLTLITNWSGEGTSSAEKVILKTLINELNSIALVTLNADETEVDQAVEKECIQTIIQHIAAYRLENNDRKKYKMRDQYQAENCEWIYAHGAQSKMIIMAHNGHVAKASALDDRKPMGQYLYEKFGAAYYVFGFDYYSGSFNAIAVKNEQNKIFALPRQEEGVSNASLFNQCKTSNFILDFETAKKDSLVNDFLTKKTYSRSIGSAYNQSLEEKGKTVYAPLLSLYDGLIFINKTNALAQRFDWYKYE